MSDPQNPPLDPQQYRKLDQKWASKRRRIRKMLRDMQHTLDRTMGTPTKLTADNAPIADGNYFRYTDLTNRITDAKGNVIAIGPRKSTIIRVPLGDITIQDLFPRDFGGPSTLHTAVASWFGDILYEGHDQITEVQERRCRWCRNNSGKAYPSVRTCTFGVGEYSLTLPDMQEYYIRRPIKHVVHDLFSQYSTFIQTGTVKHYAKTAEGADKFRPPTINDLRRSIEWWLPGNWFKMLAITEYGTGRGIRTPEEHPHAHGLAYGYQCELFLSRNHWVEQIGHHHQTSAWLDWHPIQNNDQPLDTVTDWLEQRVGYITKHIGKYQLGPNSDHPTWIKRHPGPARDYNRSKYTPYTTNRGKAYRWF